MWSTKQYLQIVRSVVSNGPTVSWCFLSPQPIVPTHATIVSFLNPRSILVVLHYGLLRFRMHLSIHPQSTIFELLHLILSLYCFQNRMDFWLVLAQEKNLCLPPRLLDSKHILNCYCSRLKNYCCCGGGENVALWEHCCWCCSWHFCCWCC